MHQSFFRPNYIFNQHSPKNQAAPIEMVIIDFFFEYPKHLLHLFLYVIKVTKPKGNCNYHVVAMTMTFRNFCPQKHNFLLLKHEI